MSYAIQTCDEHPCAHHGTCHCRCVCQPDGEDNCDDCKEGFDER